MAATRLIALHVNKGKTVAQCLADRTDYSQNAAKTNDGEFISSYECDPKTADEEFLLSKRQYQHITGRQQKNNIIAYQIRQSFKPGEITPEEANQVGYETAMRWTKGKHAFIVATHIDKSHIHNPHCAEIEAAAKSRMNTILPQLMKHYGVTERLKAANQLEWVRQMNACVAQAEEVIKDELIYS